MPRRKSPSRSDSQRRSRSPPRKSRRDSRSRSRGRGGRGGGGRSREKEASRSRSGGRGGRGGGGGGRGGAKEVSGKPLPEWGTAGVIQELKSGGIGFIRPDSGKVDDKDLFFHKSALKNYSFDDLQIGEEVTYEAQLDEAKNKAAARNILLKNIRFKKPPPSKSRSRSRRRR
mmetsp:Transcript_69459/g.125238  ORF Transcript_69459/g.125238 Transcript_69459/m.125238 type:complete len:172 (-) Transcript_69459:41-556(-)